MTNIFKKIISTVKSKGFIGLFQAVCFRIFQAVCFRILGVPLYRAKCFSKFKVFIKGKVGLEIGGPSQVFMKRDIFPVYLLPSRIDNCTYGNNTVWEGKIKEGETFHFNLQKKPGWQFLTEATDLKVISSNSYDFLLSSHMLEHSANPILALTEWVRVLKDKGLLVLLLPDKDATFDHLRSVTTIEHLISDFNIGMGEDDLTHMSEIITLHDFERDPEADKTIFKARCERNFENRCIHHHVFDTSLAIKLIDYMGLQIRAVETIVPLHILIVAQKLEKKELVDNSVYTA